MQLIYEKSVKGRKGVKMPAASGMKTTVKFPKQYRDSF